MNPVMTMIIVKDNYTIYVPCRHAYARVVFTWKTVLVIGQIYLALYTLS